MALFREQQFIRPRRKQSFLFKVKEIIDLENYLEDEDNCNIDRYIVGCILFAIFSRARFGDLRFTERSATSTGCTCERILDVFCGGKTYIDIAKKVGLSFESRKWVTGSLCFQRCSPLIFKIRYGKSQTSSHQSQ